MNYENIIIIILSIYIYCINDESKLFKNLLFKDLLVNEITKIIILFFIIFNKNNLISLLLLWAYVLSLNYISPSLLEHESRKSDLLYKENNKESIEKDRLELEKYNQLIE